MPLDTGLSITPGRVVGQPIDRRDGRLKVTGRARYAAEFDIDNLAHAVLVQSTIASGEIIGFDLADAQAVPGVLTIMTPDNAPRLPQAGSGQSGTTGPLVAKPLLQDKLVYYNGQHIALAVADTLERAQQAAALVRVQYREAEAQIRMQDALGSAYPPKNFRNGARPPDSRRGDPEAALAAAHRTTPDLPAPAARLRSCSSGVFPLWGFHWSPKLRFTTTGFFSAAAVSTHQSAPSRV